MKGERPARWLFAAQVAALVGGSLWLRVFSLESIPLHNPDESIIGLEGLRLIRGEAFSPTTTSGNPIDPFLVAMQAPFQWAMGPSLLALRIPAAISGVAAVALLFGLFRKSLGASRAAMAALLMATLPVAVLFSRHALEYCQTPLIGVIAAWAAIRGRPVALLLAFLCALLVHPTNIFLIPLLLPAFLCEALRARRGDRGAMVRLLGSTALALIAVVGPFALWARRNANVLDHAHDSRDPLRLLRGLGRFLHARLAMTGPTPWSYDATMALVAALVVVPGVILATRRRRWDRLALVAGLILGLAAFDVKAGAEVLDGPAYRYGAVFLAPIALAFAAMLDEIAQAGRRARLLAWAAVCVIAWVGLGSAWQYHLRPYMGDGADSIARLRSRDGFRLALRWIERDRKVRPGTGRSVLLAQDQYLNGMQFEYLAHDSTGVEVRHLITLADIWRRTQDHRAFAPQEWLVRHILETGGYAVQLDSSDPMRGGDLIANTVAATYPPKRVKAWRPPAWGGQSLTVFRLVDDATAARDGATRR